MPSNVSATEIKESQLQSQKSPDPGDWRISVAPMMERTKSL